MKPKIYLETTLFNYYFLKDITRQTEIEATKRLFEEVGKGKWQGYISVVTIGELENCPDVNLRKKMLRLISDFALIVIEKDTYKEFEKLAREYIKTKAIPPRKIRDAFHIAVATLSGMDILASWNCDHIVRYKTQQIVHGFNLAKGLKYISINTPQEVIGNEE